MDDNKGESPIILVGLCQIHSGMCLEFPPAATWSCYVVLCFRNWIQQKPAGDCNEIHFVQRVFNHCNLSVQKNLHQVELDAATRCRIGFFEYLWLANIATALSRSSDQSDPTVGHKTTDLVKRWILMYSLRKTCSIISDSWRFMMVNDSQWWSIHS